MMIDLCNKLVDNDLTRENLLERVEIRKTSVEDLEQVCKVLAKSFNLSSYLEALFQLENSKARLDESVKLVDKELRRKFTPEFINRIDQIVYFNSLTDDNLKNIVKLEINKFNNRLNNIEYNIEYTDDVVNYIHAEAIKKKELGARPIIRLIQTNIEDKITELMLTNDYKPKYVFHASCESDEIVIK